MRHVKGAKSGRNTEHSYPYLATPHAMTFFYLTFSSTICLNRSKHFGFTLHIKVSAVNTALTLLLKGGLVEGLSTPPDPRIKVRQYLR